MGNGDYQIMFAVTGFPIWNYVAIGYNFWLYLYMVKSEYEVTLEL